MQEDVFRGLGDWRQEALPDDMAKWRDLNLHEPGYNTAALQRGHQRENQLRSVMNYKTLLLAIQINHFI